MAQESHGSGDLTGPAPEPVFQRCQRAVVPDRDGTHRPRHGGKMQAQEPPPPPGRDAAEAEHGEIPEMERHDAIRQGDPSPRHNQHRNPARPVPSSVWRQAVICARGAGW